MKRVVMVATMAGPEGVLRAGEVREVEDGLADELLAGGYAVEVDGPVIETATLEPLETADLPRPRTKRVATKRGAKKAE
jgi:hypothetical protein